MACSNEITLKDGDVVPCGHCPFCLQLNRMDWCFRLSEEQRVSRSSYFLTLTYDPRHLPSHGDLVHEHYVLFMKRLRKFQSFCYDGLEPVRYYLVGEYGDRSGRPHYHAIIFNLIPQTVAKVEQIWGLGRVHVGSVTDASIGYVTSYVVNRFNSPGRVPPFLVCPAGRDSVTATSLHRWWNFTAMVLLILCLAMAVSLTWPGIIVIVFLILSSVQICVVRKSLNWKRNTTARWMHCVNSILILTLIIVSVNVIVPLLFANN